MMNEETKNKIEETIKNNSVVLYMKGTRKIPQCGFSAVVVDILEREGVNEFADVNVLEDPQIREGIKEFTNWPTIPQLYVNGEFVGGADIIREMYENDELKEVLNS